MINRLHACKASQYSEPVSENGCLKHLPKSLVMTFCHRLPCSDQLIIDIKIPSTAIRQGFCTLTIYVSSCLPMLFNEKTGKCATKAMASILHRCLLAPIQRYPDFTYTCCLCNYTGPSTMH